MISSSPLTYVGRSVAVSSDGCPVYEEEQALEDETMIGVMSTDGRCDRRTGALGRQLMS